MKQALVRLDKIHKTTVGYLAFGLVELALAYGFALWAIDNGAIILYVVTLVLLVGALQNFVKLVGRLVHGRKAS